MAANLKARIAALKTTAAAGASGVATIARTNAWREWASAQNMDIVSFCEFALSQLTDDNDAQQQGHTCRDLILRGGGGDESYLDQVDAAAEDGAKIQQIYGLLHSRMAMTSLEVPTVRPAINPGAGACRRREEGRRSVLIRRSGSLPRPRRTGAAGRTAALATGWPFQRPAAAGL